jgi:hypothetical protein
MIGDHQADKVKQDVRIKISFCLRNEAEIEIKCVNNEMFL